MILDAFNKINDKRSADTQAQVINANIKAIGSSETQYSIQLNSGNILTNITGPAGLNVGDSVVVSVYPGKNKKYTIIGKAGGASSSTATTVRV